jgi:hypothetical protein
MKVRLQGKRRASVWLRLSLYFFLVAGIAILGYCAYAWLDARVYQRNEERSFEEIKLSAPPPVPGRPAPPIPHAVLGKIEIQQVGISAMIAEGVDHVTLKRAVGHIPGSISFPARTVTSCWPRIATLFPAPAQYSEGRRDRADHLARRVPLPRGIHPNSRARRRWRPQPHEAHADAGHLLPVLLRRFRAQTIYTRRAHPVERALLRCYPGLQRQREFFRPLRTDH